MPEPKVSTFEGWAVVEMFGHTKEVGFVTTEAFGQAILFRCDTPSLPEREYVLKSPEYAIENPADPNLTRWCREGTKVKRQASPAKSRLIGPGAIYSITPCSEETAMKALESLIRRPLILLELPKEEAKQLAEPQDRKFACCGGNPEDGHSADCPQEEDDEEEVLIEGEDDIPY